MTVAREKGKLLKLRQQIEKVFDDNLWKDNSTHRPRFTTHIINAQLDDVEKAIFKKLDGLVVALEKPVDAKTLHEWHRTARTKINIKRFRELERKYPWLTFELFIFLLGYERRTKEVVEALR